MKSCWFRWKCTCACARWISLMCSVTWYPRSMNKGRVTKLQVQPEHRSVFCREVEKKNLFFLSRHDGKSRMIQSTLVKIYMYTFECTSRLPHRIGLNLTFISLYTWPQNPRKETFSVSLDCSRSSIDKHGRHRCMLGTVVRSNMLLEERQSRWLPWLLYTAMCDVTYFPFFAYIPFSKSCGQTCNGFYLSGNYL